jgi:hypothetical protein
LISAPAARAVNRVRREFSLRPRARLQPSAIWALSSSMAQVIQIDPTVFEEASNLASVGETVALAPTPVAEAQPIAHPAWYLTPVAAVPIAAAAFIIGNVLMMIPWSVF